MPRPVRASSAAATKRHAIRDLTKRFRAPLALQMVLSLVSGLGEVFVLIVVVRLGLAIVEGNDVVDFGPLALSVPLASGAMMLMLLIKLAVNVLSAWLAADLGFRALAHYRIELLRSFFGARWEELSVERQGHLQDLVGTDGERAASLPGTLAALGAAVTSFIVVVGAAVVVSPLAAVMAIAVGGGLAAALRPLSARTRRSSRESQRLRSLLSSKVAETSRIALEARVFGVDQAALNQLEEEHRLLETDFRRLRFNVWLTPYLYQNMVLVLVVLSAWALSFAGPGEVEQSAAALLLLLRAFSYGQSAQSQYQSLLVNEPSLEALLNRQQELDVQREESGDAPMPSQAMLRFERVSFAYPDGSMVLQHLDFEVAAGESIGIIGPSGAGKSTLLQILLRLRQPTHGSFTVGGIESTEISLSDWHAKVAFVPQEPKLITNTVAANIAFLRPADRDDVIHAARLAHIYDEIAARPGQFDEPVGEGGSAFSGGQRQRITIARALLADPEILILDEPTSALDGESEAGLHQTLDDLKGKLTLIVVSHRMSTLAKCDRVLVLGEGTIEAFDTHERLLDRSPFYVRALSHAGMGQSDST